MAVIALLGPTASGKTAAALAIAKHHPVEIISIDSALVYRGMDIGTAKPTAQERAQVPHHLIDICEPSQPYSAAAFATDASRLIAEINQRGRLALLTGGTMLYYKALTEGLDAMPTSNSAVRAVIAQQAAALGWPALHAELALHDPVTAARLHPQDTQRIARALEVFRISGQPLSAHQRRYQSPDVSLLASESTLENIGGATKMIAARAGIQGVSALICLEPLNRAWLHQRIAQRFDAMLEAGLIAEVAALRSRGDLQADLPSMRAVGYRQVWEMLDTGSSIQDMREKALAATRQLAKRQLTWLRSMHTRLAIAADAPDVVQQVLAAVQASPALKI